MSSVRASGNANELLCQNGIVREVPSVFDPPQEVGNIMVKMSTRVSTSQHRSRATNVRLPIISHTAIMLLIVFKKQLNSYVLPSTIPIILKYDSLILSSLPSSHELCKNIST